MRAGNVKGEREGDETGYTALGRVGLRLPSKDGPVIASSLSRFRRHDVMTD